MTTRHLSAVPIVSESGQPIGVLSRTDIVAHDCRRFASLQPELDALRQKGAALRLHDPAPDASATPKNQVWEIMNPVFFSVACDTAAAVVIDAMLSLNVHRLFVQDDAGKLVGVVSTTDVLRHLHPQPPEGAGG